MWDSPSGLVILGSYESPTITEKIVSDDGTTSLGFDLVTDTYSACVINLGSTMLVTGGGTNDTFTRVVQYSETGYVRDLPRLNHARYYHGCSYFDNDQGTKVHSVIFHISDKVKLGDVSDISGNWRYVLQSGHLSPVSLLNRAPGGD